MGRRQALPPWLLAAAILALAAAALFSAGAASAASEPIPTNYTIVPAGNSSFAGSFNLSNPVWFLLSGNLGDYRSVNISGAGPYSIAYLYQPVGNGTRIDAVGGDTTFAGTLGPQSGLHPFYNTTSYFLKLAVWTVAPNYTEDVTYEIRFFVGPMPVVRPGTPVTARLYTSYGNSGVPGEPMITEQPWFRLDANRSDRITATATLSDVVQAPTSGPVTFTFWAYSFERPYSGVDIFPNGWMRYVTQYGQMPEYWAWQLLNASECMGDPCATSIDFIAPYDGPFFVTLSATLIPADLQIEVSMAVAPNASLDGNDHVDDAPSLFHVPQVAGALSYAIDWVDWYRLPLVAGDAGTLTLIVAQNLSDTPGNLEDTFELMLLTPDATRAVAVAVMPTPASTASTVSIYFPPSVIDQTGDYLVRVSMIGAGGLIGIICVNDNCTGGGNATLHGHSAYTLSIGQPNLPPAPVSPDVFQNGTEDLPLTFELPGLFTDPEADPLTYSVAACSPDTTATVDGTVLTIAPPADFNGEVTCTVNATDWFGASGSVDVHTRFTAVPDPPRFNASALPSPLAWDRSETSDALDLSSIVFDPDGDPLTITATSVPSILVIPCGDLCLQFHGQPNETYGDYTATIHAQDPNGLSATATINLSIRFVNLRPSKAAGAPDPLTIVARPLGVPLYNDTTCHDADGDPTALHYHGAMLGLPESAVNVTAFGPNLRIAVPDEVHAGSWAIELACSDAGGQGPAFTIAVVVVPPLHSPVLVFASPAVDSPSSLPENSSLAFSAYFIDRDNDSITYSWRRNGLPIEGAVANGTTVAFGYWDAGDNIVTLTATDTTGLAAEVTWRIHVTEVVSPPVCGIVASNITGGAGVQIGLSSSSYSLGGDPLFYLWTANGTFLSDTDQANATLVDGTLVVRLRVTTGSATDQCEVTLTGQGDGPAPPPPEGETGSSEDMTWALGALLVGAAGAGVAFLLQRRGSPKR